MGIVETIKKGFGVAFKSLDLVFTLFTFGLVWSGANLYYSKQVGPDAAANPSPMTALLGGLFLLTSIFMQSGSLAYVRDKIKTGAASLATFTASGFKYYLRLLGLGLLIALAAGIVLAIAGLLMRFLATAGLVIAVILGAVGIYFILLVFLAPYVIVADEGKVFKSISQSVVIVRKNILAVLGVVALLVLIGLGIGLLLGLAISLLSLAVKGTASQIVMAVLSSLVNAFLGTIVSGTFMSFYFSRGSNNTTGA